MLISSNIRMSSEITNVYIAAGWQSKPESFQKVALVLTSQIEEK